MEGDRDLRFQDRATYCEDEEGIPCIYWQSDLRCDEDWMTQEVKMGCPWHISIQCDNQILVFLCVHARFFHLPGICLHATYLA
jgi:hypothetical protein